MRRGRGGALASGVAPSDEIILAFPLRPSTGIDGAVVEKFLPERLCLAVVVVEVVPVSGGRRPKAAPVTSICITKYISAAAGGEASGER